MSKQYNIDAQNLTTWFKDNHRDLPWRKNQDPYRIWISEVMLQQTTSQAVIPYYNKFIARFPTVKSLADAPQTEVLAHWAGLGYYSRARNLHAAAKILNAEGFPKTFRELIELPGFGPYTARAVSSLAFEEPVGVLDGNVIRILSRKYGLKTEWWKTTERDALQNIADALASSQKKSSPVNQAMMELGATVCTPKSPSCFICPWNKTCVARAKGIEALLPLKKQKKEGLIVLWQPVVVLKNKKMAFVENDYAPFLKGSKILPGQIQILKERPKKFDYKHTITKYEIYTIVPEIKSNSPDLKKHESAVIWLDLKKISEQVPYNLVLKTLKHLNL